MSGGPGNQVPGQPAQPAPAPRPQPQQAAAPSPLLPPHEMVKFSHFLHQAAHNPETRHVVAALANKLDPQGLGKAFTDVSIANQLNAFRKELKDKDLEREIDQAKRAQAKEKQELVDTGRYSKEEIEDIEKTMIAKGMHSYKDGAILWQAEQPPSPPPVPEASTATWEFPSVTDRNGKPVDFKDFQKDSKGASWNAAYRVIDEFKMHTLPPRFRAA
jgi:hypothetical protein